MLLLAGTGVVLIWFGVAPLWAEPSKQFVASRVLTASETLSLRYFNGKTRALVPADGDTAMAFGNFPATATDALTIFGLEPEEVTEGTVYLRAYVKFPDLVLPAGSVVESAFLDLYVFDCTPVSGPASIQAGLYRLAGSWSENSLRDWDDSNPPFQTPAQATITVARGNYSWYQLNVTALAGQLGPGSNYGLMVSSSPNPDDPAGLACRCHNRVAPEQGQRPRLVITYRTSSPPVINEPVYEDDAFITGSAPAGALVEIYDRDTGVLLASGSVQADGSFSAGVLSALKAGQRIYAQSDGLSSQAVTVLARPAPVTPLPTVVGDGDRDVPSIPEPTSLLLLAGGLLGLWLYVRRARG